MIMPVRDEASETFIQRLYGEWSDREQATLERRLTGDPQFAEAYRRVEKSWRAFDMHAESPEVMGYREEAISTMRRVCASLSRSDVSASLASARSCCAC